MSLWRLCGHLILVYHMLYHVLYYLMQSQYFIKKIEVSRPNSYGEVQFLNTFAIRAVHVGRYAMQPPFQRSN